MRVAGAIARTPKWMAVPGILIAAAVAMQNPARAGEPSTSVQTEYLMTLHVPLAPPLAVDQSLLVIGASTPGGWVEGPRIKGKLVGPTGDWLRVMPSGVLRQDVRGTIQTDTNDLIFVSYNSAIQCSKEQMDRMNAGEELKTGDCAAQAGRARQLAGFLIVTVPNFSSSVAVRAARSLRATISISARPACGHSAAAANSMPPSSRLRSPAHGRVD